MANDITLEPDATVPAGTRTAATSTDWDHWANDARTAFSNAASDAMDATVSDAVETYGSNLSGTLSGVAHDVDVLGLNTVAATHAMTNSDAHSTGILNRQGSAADAQGHNLFRRIDA